MEKTLESWGASSSLNLAEAPAGADAVVAGKIDAVNSDMPSLLNLPLEIFMPNQVRLDYEFVSTDTSKLSDLKGKTIDVGTTTSAEYEMMPALLKYTHLTANQVHYEITGSSSGSSLGTQLTTGRADAAWVHVSAVANIKAAVPHLYVLAKATSVLPSIADSFWAATPSWLKSHPAIAEVLCLAWIEAARTFNDHAGQWVSDAEAYTLNADPSSEVSADHATFVGLHLWPLAESSYSSSMVDTNYKFYKQFGEFSGSGIRSLSKVAIYGPWTAAWQVYEAHPGAY
jgi:ABC-type taurine transport system substrate-binding protein